MIIFYVTYCYNRYNSQFAEVQDIMQNIVSVCAQGACLRIIPLAALAFSMPCWLFTFPRDWQAEAFAIQLYASAQS